MSFLTPPHTPDTYNTFLFSMFEEYIKTFTHLPPWLNIWKDNIGWKNMGESIVHQKKEQSFAPFFACGDFYNFHWMPLKKISKIPSSLCSILYGVNWVDWGSPVLIDPINFNCPLGKHPKCAKLHFRHNFKLTFWSGTEIWHLSIPVQSTFAWRILRQNVWFFRLKYYPTR